VKGECKRVTTKRAYSILILLTICASFFFGVEAAKRTTGEDVDKAGAPGALIYYQLKDEEGGLLLRYNNGVPVRRMPGVIVVDFTDVDARRDEKGRKLFAVRVDRPPSLGGALYLEGVPFDSGRDPGTIDFPKPEDLVN
jgi:hypothetical protein